MCSPRCKSYIGTHLHPYSPHKLQTSLPLHKQKITAQFTKSTRRITIINNKNFTYITTHKFLIYYYYQLVAKCSWQKWRWPSRDLAWFSFAPHTQTGQQSNQQEQDTYTHPKGTIIYIINKQETTEMKDYDMYPQSTQQNRTLRWLSIFSKEYYFNAPNITVNRIRGKWKRRAWQTRPRLC